ncbi:MAG: hypothetical protein ACTHOE_14095 [Conexibacter sp.]
MTAHALTHLAPALPLLAAALAGGCGGSGLARESPPAAPVARPFSERGIWNAPLPARPRLARASAAIVAALAREARREHAAGADPWVNDTVPLLVVPRDQPTVAVRLVEHAPDRALERAWRAVPLPEDARPSADSDAELTVWQPSTDRLWEFWRLRRGPRGWQARWGGAMSRVHRNAGRFSPAAWPGAKRWWGATATSLPLLGGLIRAAELRRGRIEHALALAAPNTRFDAFAFPAQRTDGVAAGATTLPEGARLRLDPTLDVAALHLPPVTEAIALAAQRYGILVRDTAPNVALYAEARSLGASGDRSLADFPWDRLQLLAGRLRARR